MTISFEELGNKLIVSGASRMIEKLSLFSVILSSIMVMLTHLAVPIGE